MIPIVLASGFTNPIDLSIDPQTGIVYISNSATSGFISKANSGGLISLSWYSTINTPAQSVVDYNSNLYVLSSITGFITKISSSGQLLCNNWISLSQLSTSYYGGFTVDSNNNLYFVSNTGSSGAISVIYVK